MASAQIVVQQVLVMFLLLGVGILIRRLGWVTEEAARQFSNLLLMIVFPALLIEVYQRPFIQEQFIDQFISMALAVIFHLLAIAVSHLCIRPREHHAYRIERLAAVYSNCGFMGFPLLSALLGEEGLFYGVAFSGVFNLVFWIHGARTCSLDDRLEKKRIVLNPGCIGFLTGFILYITQLPLPSFLCETITHVANLNTPLAMIITGVFLADIRWKKLWDDASIWRACLLRNMLLPLGMFVLLRCIGFASWFSGAPEIALAHLIACACPSAASTILLAAKRNMDSAHGAKILALSTLLSIVTLPAIVLLAQSV